MGPREQMNRILRHGQRFTQAGTNETVCADNDNSRIRAIFGQAAIIHFEIPRDTEGADQTWSCRPSISYQPTDLLRRTIITG
jgi:hypothetical protein